MPTATTNIELPADPRGLGQRAMESAWVVSIYESRLWRRNPLVAAAMGISFDRELACIAEAARIDEAASVLDLACGPGIYTRPFARRLPRGRVIGLDLSRPMLRYARTRSRSEGLSNLDLVRGTALALPFRPGSFDVVNCCGALHLFPDVGHSLAEIERVLVPGGRFTAAVMRAGERPTERRAARLRGKLFGVHSFTRAELDERLRAAGFRETRFPHRHGLWMIAAAKKPYTHDSGAPDRPER